MRFVELPHTRSPVEHEAGQWLLGIQAGERAAFRQLYYGYYEPLSRFISLVTSDPEHVEEWMQKTFLTVWYRAADFTVDCAVLTWMLGLGCEFILSLSEPLFDFRGTSGSAEMSGLKGGCEFRCDASRAQNNPRADPSAEVLSGGNRVHYAEHDRHRQP
jgi:hypothetical protein